MIKFTHTKGPWRLTRTYQNPCSVESVAHAADEMALAKVFLTDPKTRKRTPEYSANARLIEAAPELSDLLREFVKIAVLEIADVKHREAVTTRSMDLLRSLEQTEIIPK